MGYNSNNNNNNNMTMMNGNDNNNGNILSSPSAASSSSVNPRFPTSSSSSSSSPLPPAANGFESAKLLLPNFLTDKKKRFDMAKNQEVCFFFLSFWFFLIFLMKTKQKDVANGRKEFCIWYNVYLKNINWNWVVVVV